MIRPHISSGPATDVFLFDAGRQELYNVGAIREDSLKATVEVFTEMLQGGLPKCTAKEVKGELELLQTAVSDLSIWDDVIGRGCHIWMLSKRETFIIRDTDFTFAPTEPFSKKKAASGKLSFAASGSKIGDVLWKMQGSFDPTGLILLVNPTLQKDASQALIYDVSNYKRSIVANGYSTPSAMWGSDKLSLSFDGVNDYLSSEDTEFMDPEMIGLADPNNRTFGSTVGSWQTHNPADTFASVSGGYSGNGGKLTIGAAAGTNLLSLWNDFADLIPGESYHFEFQSKYQTAWAGKDVIIEVGGFTFSFVPTSSYQRIGFDFVAQTNQREINLSCVDYPATGNILWIDSLSLRTTSDLSLNNGEMIFIFADRNFEPSGAAYWQGIGNHTLGAGQGRGGVGTSAMKITSTALGDRIANCVRLDNAHFAPIVAGRKYTIEFWAKIGTQGTAIGFGVGNQGNIAETIIDLSTSQYTKCARTLIADEADEGQSFRMFLHQADAVGTLIDDISITEAVDATVIVWFKKGSSTGAMNTLLGTFLTKGWEIGVRDNAGNRFFTRFNDGMNEADFNGPSVDDSTWHCGIVTFTRGENARMYVDGVVEDPIGTDMSLVGKVDWQSGRKLTMGARPSADYFYSGKIGIAGIKRGVVWSADEVAKFYNSTRGQYGV